MHVKKKSSIHNSLPGLDNTQSRSHVAAFLASEDDSSFDEYGMNNDDKNKT